MEIHQISSLLMTNQLFIGMDPGQTGYSCLLDPLEKNIAFICNDEGIVNLSEWLMMAQGEGNIRIAAIEEVHSIKGASCKSNFQFGRNVQILHDALTVTATPFELVKPIVWQKKIGLIHSKINTTATGKRYVKQAVKEIAHKLYPDAPLYGPKGGFLDGKADALMIAHYAYLTHKLG